MRKVAIFDLDKTIYRAHSFFELAANEGFYPEMMVEYKKYKASEQDYSTTALNLLQILATGLIGKNYEDELAKTEKFFENNQQNFFPYFEAILPKLKETHDVFLATTNTQMVAEIIKRKFGLAGYISTEFEVIDGKFTGKILSTLATGKKSVKSLVDQYGVNGSIAVGDSENDIEMLKLVERAVCINPSEELKAVATEKNWIVTTDTQAESEFGWILGQ